MTNKSRVVFMGTPYFAVKSLDTLHKNFNVVAVVTAPDKKRGRGQKVIATPVKQYAIHENIPVLQPTNLKSESFVKELESFQPEVNAIVAFRMLPEVIWNMPGRGSINLHASLLPDYRGAAPINHAVINGETITGVSTFFLEKNIDTGSIIMQKEVPVEKTDNAGTLHDKLMHAGAELLKETIEQIVQGTAVAQPQNATSNKKAPKIFKENCRINWSLQGEKIYNFVRGLSPYPAAWTKFMKNNKPFTAKIFEGNFEQQKHDITHRTILTNKNKLQVALKDGLYEITDIQPQSKKRISGTEFVRGLQKSDDLKLARE